MEQQINSALGRKVFFLYPHSVFDEGLLLEIFDKEYEIYVLKDHMHALSAIRKFPGSILFVNIDEGMKEPEWEKLIRSILDDQERHQTKIGILTYNQDNKLAEKYLISIGVQCGFIRLNQGLVESKKIILTTLDANEARGRRRYVRARCTDPNKASFNIKRGTRIHPGIIHDISAAGMTYSFHSELFLNVNEHLDDIQLKLRGSLCQITGAFKGEVREGTPRNLLMFDLPLKEETAGKIHRFIFRSLQEEMMEIIGAK
jgi:hypothetical protein